MRRKARNAAWAAAVAAGACILSRASRAAQASLATYELVPTSISSGTGSIQGNTVSLNAGAGSIIQFNVEIVVHDSSGAPANNGIEEVNGGLAVTANHGLSGAFALPSYGAGFGANGTGSQLGTKITSGSNTNIGNETAFGTAISLANGANNDFKPYSNSILSAGFTTGTPLANGDTPIIVGTTSLTISGTSGSLTAEFLPDLQTSGPSGNVYDQIFENHGVQYTLNGVGTSQDGTITNGIDANTVTIQLVPEPASLGLVAIGSLGLLIRRRKAVASCGGH